MIPVSCVTVWLQHIGVSGPRDRSGVGEVTGGWTFLQRVTFSSPSKRGVKPILWSITLLVILLVTIGGKFWVCKRREIVYLKGVIYVLSKNPSETLIKCCPYGRPPFSGPWFKDVTVSKLWCCFVDQHTLGVKEYTFCPEGYNVLQIYILQRQVICPILEFYIKESK